MSRDGAPTRDTAEAVEVLALRHQSPLIRYAQRFVSSEETARDVVQEAFVRYLRQTERNGAGPRAASNWLFRVTHNLCVDHIRKESRMRESARTMPAPPPPPGPDAELRRGESDRRVGAMLGRLTENQRAVIMLKVFEDKSYREISAITGLSISNVGLNIHRALKKLGAAIQRGETIEP